MAGTTLLAGAATRVITPPLGENPVFLAGFQPDRRATGVHLDLYVRALALQLGQQSMVLVSCDLIGLGRPDIEEIRAVLGTQQIDPASLIVACTHTHSGPDTLGLWGATRDQSGVDSEYLASVKRAVVAAADEALAVCSPVQMRVAMTVLPDQIINHRTPGLVDDSVAALQFTTPEGRVIATLMNLACHPEVLLGDSTLISPDYAGVACQAIEQAAGGIALHVSGALGGMLSPATADHSPLGAEAMGRAYADVVLAALRAAHPMEADRLESRRALVELPMQNPLFVAAQESGVLQQRSSNGNLTTTCVYVDLGPAQLITVPGELLPNLGFALKAALRGPCRLVVGLAEDEIGYILSDDEFVTPADYAAPGTQYEESMSLGPHTGSLIMAASLHLIAGRS